MTNLPDNKQRCPFDNPTPLSLNYHDNIWGTPSFDRRFLFEMFSLSGFQAGLNWWTVYKKLDAFRAAFYEFDIDKIADCQQGWIEEVAENPDIIRNRVKIGAVVWNAQQIRKAELADQPFVDLLWSTTNNQPVFAPHIPGQPFPARSPEGDALSRKLKQLKFKFCGPTICHAFMQSVGMIVQHTEGCFRYQEIKKQYC